MDQSPPIRIPRSTLESLLQRLPSISADVSSRALDVELFKLIDLRPVRTALRAAVGEDILDNRPPGDAGEIDRRLADLPSFPYEDWVSESHEFDTDYYDDEGRLVFEVAQFGYLNEVGEFVARPLLTPIPAYTRVIEDALSFKSSAFGSYLTFELSEVEGEWGSDYVVRLLDRDLAAVADYRSDTVAIAIVGAVLAALLGGWTHDLSSFRVSGE